MVTKAAVVIENSGDDGKHACADHLLSYLFSSAGADEHDALERQGPLPCGQELLLAGVERIERRKPTGLALVENGHQALDAAVVGQRLAHLRTRRHQVRQVVQRVDERLIGGDVERPPVVEAGGDGDGGSVVGNGSIVGFSHGYGEIYRDVLEDVQLGLVQGKDSGRGGTGEEGKQATAGKKRILHPIYNAAHKNNSTLGNRRREDKGGHAADGGAHGIGNGQLGNGRMGAYSNI